MKRKIIYFLSVFILLFNFSACQNQTQKKTENQTKNQTQEKIENQTENQTQGKTETQTKSEKLVRVQGHLYRDTNLVNSAVTCATADGKIKSTVDKNSEIKNDDEGNFGIGYEYQFMDKTHINVNIDGRWIIFNDVSSNTYKMPDGVANIEAKVKEVQKAGVLCEITEIPKEFEHIFGNKKPDEIKPIFISLDDYRGEDMTDGKIFKVYFDGKVINLSPETSSPIKFEEIYLVK